LTIISRSLAWPGPQSLKTVLKQALNRTVASLLPPVGAQITERNKLRGENSKLLGETDRLTAENDKLAARLTTQETRSDICDEFYGGFCSHS
jgi:regulator of replication initiation timing